MTILKEENGSRTIFRVERRSTAVLWEEQGSTGVIRAERRSIDFLG